jgi:lipopolysaccharide biosynthesis glycosyltransferase
MCIRHAENEYRDHQARRQDDGYVEGVRSTVTHVVLASDAKYLEYVHCVLGQVSVHGPSCDGVILVVPPGLDAAALMAVERSGAALGIPLQVVELPQIVDLVPAKAIRRHDHVTAFTFARLLLPTALTDVDQVLYLDIDILVRDSIEELLNWELTNPIGAVHETGDRAVHLFGSARVSYFNAGVMRMSLAHMRDMDFLRSAQAILRERPRLRYHDQDVLNLIFRDHHDSLPLAFNVFEPVASAGLPAWKVLTDPAIVHFVGPDKPWLDDYSSRFTREWRAAQAHALSSSPELERRYARSAASGAPRNVAATITHVRGSAVGRWLRSALPVPLKTKTKQAVFRLLPRRSKLLRQLRKGMLADVDATGTEESVPGPSA